MDEARRRRWTEAAARVLAEMERQTGCDPDARDAASSMVPMWKRLESALDASGLVWDAEVNATWHKGRFRSPVTERDVHVAGPDGRRMKALRAAWRVTSGDAASVPRSERAVVARALGEASVPDGAADPPGTPSEGLPPSMDGPVTVTFRFVRQLRPKAHVLVDGFGTAVIEPVDASDAPVVARLRTLDGHAVEVRRMGDTFLRPVLAPGSWEALDLDGFRRASREGEAWADDPFRVPCGRDGADVMAHDDLVTPGAAKGRSGATLDGEAASRARGHAGRLFAVGGVVHRECPEPTLSKVLLTVGRYGHMVERQATLGWRIGDQVDLASSQDHMRPSPHKPMWVPTRTSEGYVQPGWCELPAGEWETAAEVFREVAGTVGDDPVVWVVPDASLVDVVRPDLLGTGTSGLVADLRRWHARGSSRDGVALVRGRLAEAGDRPAPEVLEELATLVRGRNDAPDPSWTDFASVTTLACFLDAAVRMSRRDAEPAHDEEVVAFAP